MGERPPEAVASGGLPATRLVNSTVNKTIHMGCQSDRYTIIIPFYGRSARIFVIIYKRPVFLIKPHPEQYMLIKPSSTGVGRACHKI